MRTLRQNLAAFGLALLCGVSSALAAPTIALQSGAPVALSIPANSFTSSYYVDVGAADQILRIDLDSASAGVDVDFFLRYGSPFPDGFSGGRPPSFDYIDELSHYRSISPINDEFVIVGRSGGQPLRAGRWYVFAFNFNTSQSTSIDAQSTLLATLSSSSPAAAFSVNFNSTGSATQPCSNTEWFDTTSVSPIGENPGTTRGEQRRNAMLRAAENLSLQIRSPVPITIDACWADLGTGNSVTLASAGPRSVISDLPAMDRKYTWYAGPPAARLAGTSFCRLAANDCNLAEIRATFNNQIDTPDALGEIGFHYGYTTAGSADNIDFISVGTHEITHGLGFLSLVSLGDDDGAIAGSEFQGMDDIFSTNLAWLDDGVLRPFNLLTNAQRLQAATSATNLKWTGASATSSAFNPRIALPFPDNLVQMYAPNQIVTGSSVSHINQIGYNGELMRPQAVGAVRELNLSRNLLDGVGWSNAIASTPINPIPLGGFFYDPSHTGHGIEFSRVTPGGDFYVLTFYTYDAMGNPEWFQAVGRLTDGKFLPEPDSNGNSLQRYTYDPSRPSGQRQQIDPGFSGRMRLDFVQAANAPVCASAQSFSGFLAVMSFALGDNQTQEWCMQELIPRTLRPPNDLTGIWYAGSQDSGWGFSLGSIPGTGAGGLFSVLYYYDAQGKPRWALSSLDNLQAGSSGPILSRNGYCRTCAIPAGFPTGRDSNIGSITYSLQAAGSAGSTVSYSASWNGVEGGTFARTASPLVILSIPAALQTGAALPGYALVWSDEFNGSGLPDDSKWNYDTEANATGWYNNERQYYAARRLENTVVGNGNLSIIARKESLTQAADYGGQRYTSGRLLTRGKANWTYGFFEVRAKLPCGLGTWPAIWMLGAVGAWPAGGEIDIMEHSGHAPDSIFGTLHMQATAGTGGIGGRTTVATACSAFHKYQATWTPESIAIGVDGTIFHTYSNPGEGTARWPFDQPQFMLLNLAIGGNFTNGVIDDSIFPVQMDVDYVRVYKRL